MSDDDLPEFLKPLVHLLRLLEIKLLEVEFLRKNHGFRWAAIAATIFLTSSIFPLLCLGAVGFISLRDFFLILPQTFVWSGFAAITGFIEYHFNAPK
jgi:hypothetical protein